MINIITGELNQGKTAKIICIFQKFQSGDGFVSRKMFEGESFLGYEIIHLKSGDKIPLAYHLDHIPGKWQEAARIGLFSFSGKGIEFAEKIIENAIDQNIEPIFIDEIGPLEILHNKGFYDILKKVLSTGIECYLTVRKVMVEELIDKFKIIDYTIIDI